VGPSNAELAPPFGYCTTSTSTVVGHSTTDYVNQPLCHHVTQVTSLSGGKMMHYIQEGVMFGKTTARYGMS
jgi:hypothetical protein